MNSKYFAGLSLVIMASGFILTLFLPDNTGLFLLKSGFEAGLVGGIADWFAVTALFRHPFGIPIPHTSLLLKNRSKIVQSLISAMENELLNKQSIENKLRKFNLFRMSAAFLTTQLGRRKIRLNILDIVIRFAERAPLADTVPFIQSWLKGYIQRMDLKNTADSLVTKAIQDGYDQKALHYILKEALGWVERPDTRVMLGKLANERLATVKVTGFMGFAVQAFAGFLDEDKLGTLLQNMLSSGIRDLQDEDNTYREAIIREIRIQLFQLPENDAFINGVKDKLASYVEGEEGKIFLLAKLEEVRGFVISRLEAERRSGGKKVFAGYRMIVRHLNKEPERLAAWESRLLGYLIHLVETNHYRIGQLVKENLDQMDDASLIRMLEDKVGNDLQWIRVNGALCGFAVGVVLGLFQL